MADTAETAAQPLKRLREEEKEQETGVEEETKRQKPSSSASYNQIVCLLEDAEEQDEPGHDLTHFITTLQQEISLDEQNAVVSDDINADNDGNSRGAKPRIASASSSTSSSLSSSKEDVNEGDEEKVMRHLLEASDDELGIPNTDFSGNDYGLISDTNYDYTINGGGLLDGFGDALWELEDEAANYYTLLQSELFM